MSYNAYLPAAFIRAASMIKKDTNLKQKLINRILPFERKEKAEDHLTIQPSPTAYKLSALFTFIGIFLLPYLASIFYTDIHQSIYQDEGIVFYSNGVFLYIALSFLLGTMITMTVVYLLPNISHLRTSIQENIRKVFDYIED